MRKFTLLKTRRAETLLEEIEQIQKHITERRTSCFGIAGRAGGRAERLARCRAPDHLETASRGLPERQSIRH